MLSGVGAGASDGDVSSALSGMGAGASEGGTP